MIPPLPDLILEPLVRAALLEDLGTNGDITTCTVIPPARAWTPPSAPAKGARRRGCSLRPWPSA